MRRKKKYTPGPWAAFLREGYETPDIFDSNGNLLLFGASIENGHGKPDVLLASAAPELLEALELMVEHFEIWMDSPQNNPVYVSAIEAISKAYGVEADGQ